MFGIDDMALAAIASAVLSAGTNVYNSYQNKKTAQAQQRAANMQAIDANNLALQQNLGTLANNRDYINNRQQDIILNTRNENQLAFGGQEPKKEKIDWETVRTYLSLIPGKIKREWKQARNTNNIFNNPVPTMEGIEEVLQDVVNKFHNDTTYNSGLYKGQYKDRFTPQRYFGKRR